ncbi:MAG TPA: protein-L-isoaspartate(D-aspartate) O-methyltransferase [Gammaproteobacteria bacterium]|jgi:protein-L-isoaspartate(D-aspartate) O-methyltransferase
MGELVFIKRLLLIGSLLWLIMLPAHATGESEYKLARERLIELIEQDVRETSEYINKTQLDQRVMDAMASVPRHEFVPERQRVSAYDNRPLAIGHGQTISQPYMVAVMTDLIKPEPGDRVLEIGTGSGYQAAILAQLVDKVFSIEIIEPLGTAAERLFQKLGYDNIVSRIGDGYYGWKEQAPFDAIVVTAAASHVPPPLIEQLKPGGHMVIPVGSRFLTQQLMLVTKDEKGQVATRQVLPVAFVPLTGEH